MSIKLLFTLVINVKKRYTIFLCALWNEKKWQKELHIVNEKRMHLEDGKEMVLKSVGSSYTIRYCCGLFFTGLQVAMFRV
jgi:hypothetical protein